MTSYVFRLTGKIQPYTRMTQRSKFVDERAQAYTASQGAIGYQLKEQMQSAGLDMLPKQPIKTTATCTVRQLHRSDGDNIIKALHDAANGIVYPDDRWIDSFEFKRILGEDEVTIFTVELL